MIIKSAELETVCGITSKLPVNTLPEVAFAGKSNVGKSSLINKILGQNRTIVSSIAGTTRDAIDTEYQGKTQTINYYNINKEIYFVDLPGYGYAKVSKSEKEKWGKMIERYLNTSMMLKKVYLLVDIRHEPNANDKQMYEWIVASGYEPVIIATKLDKINRSQKDKHLKMLREGLRLKKGTLIIPFSAQTKQGREEIYEDIIATVNDEVSDDNTETTDMTDTAD